MKEYIEYCTGCGLCHSVKGIKLKKNQKGFLRPYNVKKDDVYFFKSVCPYYNQVLPDDNSCFWGDYIGAYSGFSTDDTTRYRASSGGIITSICKYLIGEKLVDGIIEVKRDNENPLNTVVVISHTEDEVEKAIGSRYIASSPLLDIKEMILKNETYAFVGKPCDVLVLKNYINKYHDLENIKYTISFFCAGTPSVNANISLVNDMGVKNIENIDYINYRGNGWPGKYVIKLKNGNSKSCDYIEAWSKFLGRDVQEICRFCFDGIGSQADISCGDYWNIKNHKPVFNEGNGENVIFSWTNMGNNILNDMYEKHLISLNPLDNFSRLDDCQPHHLKRRATLFSCTMAMRLMLKRSPKYNMSILKKYTYKVSKNVQWSYFKGIVSRILKGKIN